MEISVDGKDGASLIGIIIASGSVNILSIGTLVYFVTKFLKKKEN